MANNQVSVVIPAWRAGATLARAVSSVLAQTHAVTEIIVVDDGSPEDPTPALAGLNGPIRVLRQDNAGASAARNLGIAAASGSLIAFLDADDEWHPWRLARQLEWMTRNPEVGLVCGGYHRIEGTEAPRYVSAHPAAQSDCVLRLDPRGAFEFALGCWTSTVLVATEAIGSRRFRTDLRTAEDREFWFQCARRVPVVSIDCALAIQHVTPGSLSQVDVENDCQNMLTLVRDNAPLFTRRELRDWERRTYRRWAGVLLAEGQPRAAVRPALERLRREPMSAEGWWTLALSVVRTLGVPK